jgi:hypothetical protein
MKYTIKGLRKVLAHPEPITITWENGVVVTDQWTMLALKIVDGNHVGKFMSPMSFSLYGDCNGINRHYEHEDCIEYVIEELMQEGYSVEIVLDDGTVVHSWDDIPIEDGDLVISGTEEEMREYERRQEQRKAEYYEQIAREQEQRQPKHRKTA